MFMHYSIQHSKDANSSQTDTQVQHISNKIWTRLFLIQKWSYGLYGKKKELRIAETIFKRRLSLEIILPDFKSYAVSLTKTIV